MTPVFRPIFVLLFLLVPLLTIYSIARYFEYSCDREAIKFTNDPEAGLQALVNLYRMTGSPITCSRIGEVFMTHPSLTDRLEAIARAAEIVLSRASAVLIEVRSTKPLVAVVVMLFALAYRDHAAVRHFALHVLELDRRMVDVETVVQAVFHVAQDALAD